MKKRAVLLRVGIDSGCGGIQGPLFEDGTFEFICIPDRKRVSDHTYGDSSGRHGKPLVDYFPKSQREHMAGQHIHVDPEFETYTYGDPTTPKRSLRRLMPGDFLIFYCGLQSWNAESGWNLASRPALYLIGFFEVALAGMAGDFEHKVLESEFGNNFHVRYPSVFELQKETLVLVKGGPGSRLFHKAKQISVDGKDRAGKPLKVLSSEMQRVFGDFGGHVSIQRSPPRWVDPGFVENAICYLRELETREDGEPMAKQNPKDGRDFAAGRAAGVAGHPSDETKSLAWQRGYQTGFYVRRRFTDPVDFVPVNPQDELERKMGYTTGLAGEPNDETKSPAWQRGHQLGRYERERLRDAKKG